jgi:hypothetical protein
MSLNTYKWYQNRNLSQNVTLQQATKGLEGSRGIALLRAFFLGGRRGTRTPKHFVNITAESKNFRMLEFPLNQIQTYYGYLRDLLSFM